VRPSLGDFLALDQEESVLLVLLLEAAQLVVSED
jgi:hypothetical protein